MFKVGDDRYNSDEIWKYYPSFTLDNPVITIETKHGLEEDIVFRNEAERDRHLEAMDKALLLIKDCIVIES